MQPELILTPFGESANPGTINEIPESLTPSDPVQSASWQAGFPLVTMTPLSAGGIPPRGQDVNGALRAISRHSAFLGGGGQYKWSAEYVAAKGGYSIGDIIQANDGLNSYVSLVNSNSVDFNATPSSIGTIWQVYSGTKLIQTQATESVSGIAKIATQQKIDEGLDDSTIATPKKIKSATYITEKIIGEACDTAGFTEGSVSGDVYFKHKPTQQFVFLAKKNSPSLTGVPTSPTAAVGVSTDQIATTAFVMSIVNNYFPKRSFGARDFIRVPDVPGGLIIQWVLDAPEATSAGDMISFPVPFTTARLGVVATLNALSTGGLTQTANIVVSSSGLNNFQYTSGGTYGGGAVAYVLAWGY